MEEEKDIALITAYLEGTLTGNDKSTLEERLNQEPGLQKILDDLNILKAGIRHAAHEEMRAELQKLEHELSASETSKPLFQNTWLKVAASVAIVAVAAWLLLPSRQSTTEQLFAQNFEPYPNVIMPTVRGGQATDSSLMAQGYRAYDQQDFKKSIELFESLEKKDEGVLLYLGNSYLASGSPEKAIPVFEKVIMDYEIFDEQAEWYLAGSYLKAGYAEKAKEALRKVTARGRSYKSRAEIILEKLN